MEERTPEKLLSLYRPREAFQCRIIVGLAIRDSQPICLLCSSCFFNCSCSEASPYAFYKQTRVFGLLSVNGARIHMTTEHLANTTPPPPHCQKSHCAKDREVKHTSWYHHHIRSKQTMIKSFTSINQAPLQVSHKKMTLVDCLGLALKVQGFSTEDLDSASSATPPLDQVTTCSEDCSDDVSDVSSCSGIDDDLSETQEMPSRCLSEASSPASPRSIFKNYWGAQGQSHKLHRPLPTEISTQIYRLICEEDASPPNNVYEETLREREEDAKLGLASKRRSIFSNHYNKTASAPTFRTQKYHDLRKIHSTTALSRRPGRSCLRRSRYSGESSPRLSLNTSTTEHSGGSEGTSVHFSDKVEITVFQTCLEQHAQEGWSDFFAYR